MKPSLQDYILVFRSIGDFVIANAQFIITIATAFVAYFAWRSAKISEQANRANFSPLLIPTGFSYEKEKTVNDKLVPSQVFIVMNNTSTYQNAYAKNIMLKIGSETKTQKTIEPGSNHYFRFSGRSIKELCGEALCVNYQDILQNRFITYIYIKPQVEGARELHIENWRYVQL